MSSVLFLDLRGGQVCTVGVARLLVRAAAHLFLGTRILLMKIIILALTFRIIWQWWNMCNSFTFTAVTPLARTHPTL